MTFDILGIKLLWTLKHNSFHRHVWLYLLSNYIGLRLPSCMIKLIFNFIKNYHIIFHGNVYHFALLPVIFESSSYSTSLPSFHIHNNPRQFFKNFIILIHMQWHPCLALTMWACTICFTRGVCHFWRKHEIRKLWCRPEWMFPALPQPFILVDLTRSQQWTLSGMLLAVSTSQSPWI